MKIVLLDAATLGDDIDTSCFDECGEVTIYQSTPKTQTLSRVKEADIVVTNKVVINKRIIDNSNIKLICVAATGMNNIDIDYAKEKDIAIRNVSGYSTSSVVQTTFSLALYLMGKLKFYDEYTKSEGWSKSKIFTNLDQPYHDIAGKQWGIIGLGEIGKGVAKVADAFGAEVVYFSTSGKNRNSDFKRVSLENLLKNSDIISIHAPLNNKTENLLNRDNLKLLKKGSMILNLGRGGIINEADLANFMDENELYVGLDVLESEPMSKNSPFLNIKNKERLFITPHIAWASVESRERLVDAICTNIKKFTGDRL